MVKFAVCEVTQSKARRTDETDNGGGKNPLFIKSEPISDEFHSATVARTTLNFSKGKISLGSLGKDENGLFIFLLAAAR